MIRNKNFKLEVVGSYSLVEEIGQGAFGCVYLAKKGNNEYALKRIQIPQMSNQ
jgi:serine/threonine protein kinase